MFTEEFAFDIEIGATLAECAPDNELIRLKMTIRLLSLSLNFKLGKITTKRNQQQRTHALDSQNRNWLLLKQHFFWMGDNGTQPNGTMNWTMAHSHRNADTQREKKNPLLKNILKNFATRHTFVCRFSPFAVYGCCWIARVVARNY